MQFALDENGNRISIEKSIKGKYYKCPCCGTEVIQKKGEVMIWHFAHKSLADCVEYYDHKGEWHRAMQELFPEQNREVYEKTESYRHRQKQENKKGAYSWWYCKYCVCKNRKADDRIT